MLAIQTTSKFILCLAAAHRAPFDIASIVIASLVTFPWIVLDRRISPCTASSVRLRHCYLFQQVMHITVLGKIFSTWQRVRNLWIRPLNMQYKTYRQMVLRIRHNDHHNDHVDALYLDYT